MKNAVTVLLAVGGLLALGACGPGAAAPTTAATATPTTAATTTATPSQSASPAAKPTPTVEKRTVTKKRKIRFTTRRVKDPTLPKGTTEVRTRGVPGVRTITYEVTFTNGEQTAKKRIDKAVTRAPVTKVIVVGTKRAPRCDPNYSGCVPIASDVDCAGGSGDGPAYVEGTVRVTGADIYDLDRDGDGIGCDPS